MRNAHLWKIAAALFLCAAAPRPVTAQPPPTPIASYLFPAGGQRGTAVELRVGGEQVAPYSRLRMDGPGVTLADELAERPPRRYVEPEPYHAPTMLPAAYPREWAARASLAADAPTGARLWRITSAQGGTSARLFVVGDLPERLEAEPNSSSARAEGVTFPLTLNGQLYPREDVDYYRLTLRAGQSITIDAVAQRIGSPADLVCEVVDDAGKVLHSQDDGAGRDPRFAFAAPRSGVYLVRVHDVGFWGGPDYVYRLTVTPQPIVAFAFPAGGRRGTRTPVQLSLARGGGSVMPPAGAGVISGSVTMAAAPDRGTMLYQAPGTANAIPLAVGDDDEVLEQEPNDGAPQRITPPLVVNGRLERPGDLDRFVVTVRKGDRWSAGCVAERIQSPVRSRLTVTGPDGKQIAEASATSAGDPTVQFTAPFDGEVAISVRDLHGAVRGGPAYIYRLEVRRAAPDFQLSLSRDFVDVLPGGTAAIDLSVVRVGGFAGPIRLEAVGLPREVRLQPARIEANQSQVKLTVTADKNADISDGTVVLTGVAETEGGELRRAARAPYAAAPPGLPALGPRAAESFLVSVTHPPQFAVETDDTFTYSPKGTTYPARLRITRQPGFGGPIRVRIADRQIRELDGFDAEEREYPADVAEGIYPVYLPETMNLSRPSSRVYVLGTSVISGKDGRRHGLLAVSPKQIVIKSQPSLLALSADRQLVSVRPGAEATVNVTLHRTPKCPEAAELRLELPPGARGISMAPSAIPAGATRGVARIRFAGDASLPTEDRIRIGARAMLNGYPVDAFATLEVELLARTLP